MRRATLAVIGVTALLAAGCGGSDEEQAPAGGGSATEEPSGGGTQSASSGRELFVRSCSGCHALADAGANGQVGPSLDEVKPDAEQVKSAIAQGPGAMPENLLQGAEADAVAEYVASAAGG